MILTHLLIVADQTKTAAPNGHPDLAVIGAVTGCLGVVLGGYAAVNTFFSKRAKIDVAIRPSLVAVRDALAAAKAAPSRVALLTTPAITIHQQTLDENVNKAASLRLRLTLRRLVGRLSEAANTPAASATGQGSHAVMVKVESAYKLACSAIDQLDAQVRRSPT